MTRKSSTTDDLERVKTHCATSIVIYWVDIGHIVSYRYRQ